MANGELFIRVIFILTPIETVQLLGNFCGVMIGAGGECVKLLICGVVGYGLRFVRLTILVKALNQPGQTARESNQEWLVTWPVSGGLCAAILVLWSNLAGCGRS